MAKWAVIVATPPNDDAVLIGGPTRDIAALKETFDDLLDLAADAGVDGIPAVLATDREGARKRGRILIEASSLAKKRRDK